MKPYIYLAALAATALTSAAAAAAPQTLKFTAVQYQFTHGQTITIRDHLLSHGKPIGDTTLRCTHPGQTLLCQGVASLPGGTIHISASLTRTKTNRGTVTSGTGRYTGAKGSFRVTDLDPSGTRSALTIKLR